MSSERTVVWPIAQQEFREAFHDQVDKGIEAYPEPLTTLNGRDSYKDFLQEHADSLNYVTQLAIEARIFVDLTVRAVQVLERATDHLEPNDPVGVDAYCLALDMRECLEKSGLSRSATPSPTESS